MRSKKHFKKNQSIKFYGYSKYPLIALNEMRKLNNKVISKLNKVKCPTLMIHSNNDRLSIKENINFINHNILSEKKKTLFVNNAHHIMFDENPDQKLIFTTVLNFLNSN